MKPKLPPISYIVTAKKFKNSAGLELIHEKVFSNENLLESRKSPFDYFSAIIEILMDEKEIDFKNAKVKTKICKDNMDKIIPHCNNYKICYKDTENFSSGIQVFIRINKPINLGNRILKVGEKLLMQSFNFLNDEENKTIAENLNTEVEIYECLKEKTGKIYQINFIDENGYHKDLIALNTYNRFNGKSFEIYKNNIESSIERKIISEVLQLIKNPNPMQIDYCDVTDLEVIAESICAFLNGNNFGYIILEQKRKIHCLEDVDMRSFFMKYFNERFVWEHHFIRFHVINDGKKKYFILSLDGKNCKDEVRFSKQLNNDYEYYERHHFGNVLVLDKCERFEVTK